MAPLATAAGPRLRSRPALLPASPPPPTPPLLLPLLCGLLLAGRPPCALADITDVPKFGEPISNVTFPVGREAALACIVEDLGTYKVAWLRVDTQTILTIATHVITKNHRIGISHSDHRTWYLQIREVKESDRGWYMCQINTDPMKSQVGYLEVVVPPDILDYPTSADMVVREGTNVSLRCAATGFPRPSITWRREAGEPLPAPSGQETKQVNREAIVEGSELSIPRVNRLHMGPYLCIASNGVPPTVSKRIMLIVHFPPMIWIQNQLVGAYDGQDMTIECHSEAYPKSINYWTLEKGEIISQGSKYEPVMLGSAYKVHMKLTIRNVTSSDFGSYRCISKNSLGETDGTIKLYEISRPSTPAPPPLPTTEMPLTSEEPEPSAEPDAPATPEVEVVPHAGVSAPGALAPGLHAPYEVVDMADPERITKERDLKLRGRPRDNRYEVARASAPVSSASTPHAAPVTAAVAAAAVAVAAVVFAAASAAARYLLPSPLPPPRAPP